LKKLWKSKINYFIFSKTKNFSDFHNFFKKINAWNDGKNMNDFFFEKK